MSVNPNNIQIGEQLQKASLQILILIMTEFGETKASHPGTAISTCARLSGSFLFRSFNFQMKNILPGNVILSEQANENGPILIGILGETLSTLGIEIDPKKSNEAPQAESNLSFIDSLNLTQDRAVKIMKQNKLSFEQMAYACSMATACVISECRNDLAMESGFNTAIYSFIEGSKTYPPELSKKKSFFKFWK